MEAIEHKEVTDKFLKVNMKSQILEEGEEGEEVSEINFYKCKECESISVACNSSLYLQNPKAIWEPAKSYFVDYLFCPKCKILENMKDKTVDKIVVKGDVNERLMARDMANKEFHAELQNFIIKDIFQ
jgi:hypothetical protein